MPDNAPEVIVKQAESPISRPPATPEASWEPRDYIKPSLIRYAQYEYKTGTQFFLSKTEQIVVDAYLKTHNENEAVRTVNSIYAAHGSQRHFTIKAVHRWLQKPHVARYIADKYLAQGKVNWLTRETWEAYAADILNGGIRGREATQVQVVVWREFGKMRGWYVEAGPSVMNNTVISFTQNTGSK